MSPPRFPRRRLRRRYPLRSFSTGAAVLVGLCVVTPAGAAEGPAGFEPFAPDSVWNLPLRSDAPLSPDSSRYIAYFRKQLDANGVFFNTGSCGTPIYWAAPGTARIAVRLDHPSYMDPALIRAWSSVPMPSDAVPANCTDRNFAVMQRQPDGTVTAWEFWAATKASDGSWTAKWGGVTQDVESDRGIASTLAWSDPTAPTNARQSKPGWNVTASSVSTLAGVVTQQELRAGHIDHALSINITGAAQGKWMWPAQRTDGSLTDADALPEGAHLRIDPSLDLSTRTMVPAVRMLAEAAQKYGFVVRDQTSGVNTFIGEQPQAGTANAVVPLLNGQYTGNAMKAFPWDALEVLDAPMCPATAECAPPDQAKLDADVGETDATLDTRNSRTNQPVTSVRWDLDGNGTYETDGGTDRSRAVSRSSQPKTVGVQLTTRSGTTVATSTVVPELPPVTASEPSRPAGETASGDTADGTVARSALETLIAALTRISSSAQSSSAAPSASGTAEDAAVSVAPLAPAPNAKIVSASAADIVQKNHRAVKVKIACTSSIRTCRGVVRVRLHARRTGWRALGTGRYVVASGRIRVVTVALSRTAAATLGSSGRTKRLKVVKRSVTRTGVLAVDFKATT